MMVEIYESEHRELTAKTAALRARVVELEAAVASARLVLSAAFGETVASCGANNVPEWESVAREVRRILATTGGEDFGGFSARTDPACGRDCLALSEESDEN